jgi:CHAT domain-containing protein/tetratricopeptide (TPR) repeat protein
MKVLIEKQSTDLEMQASDPSGKLVADISLGETGTIESFWALASVTGNYQIKITAPEIKGSYGRYLIRLEDILELTAAPASDQKVRAYRLFWEAGALRDRGGAEGFRAALEKYQEALTEWRGIGDRVGEALTLHETGYIYSRLSEQKKAAAAYEHALPIWRTLKNHRREEANTLYNLGAAYASYGKVTEAVTCFQEAIQLQQLVDKGGLAYTLSNLGQVYTNIGDFQAALKSHQEALSLRMASGDIEGQARSLSNISGVYFGLGEFQEALNYCKRALPLRRAAGDRRGEAITLANMGNNYRELGDPRTALEFYQQALPLLQGLADRDRTNEAALLDAIGRAYYDLGDYPKALTSHNQSFSLRQLVKDRYGEGSSLDNLGNTSARMGDRKKALEYFEQALELRRATGDRRGAAATLQHAGELYSEAGEQEKATAYFNNGLTLSRTIKNRFIEANLLYDLARVDQSAGHLLEALAQVEDAIAIVESNRARVASADLRTSFFASKQDFYELNIDLLMQSYRRDLNQENLVKAFSVSERRRARSLLDSLGEAQSNIRRIAPPALLARERELRAKLNQKAENQIKLLSGQHTAEQAAALAKDVETVSTDYEQALAEVTASDPHYAALTQSGSLSLSKLQSEILDPDTLLLEYSLGQQRSYLWAITRTDITAYELPGRAEIDNQARDLYGFLTSRNRFIKFEKPDERQARIAKADNEYLQAAERLSQLLLGQLGKKIAGKRLLIVSDGALQYLPFAALPSPGASTAKQNEPTNRAAYRPLIVDHEVTNLPSAAILEVLRREVRNRKPAPKSVAVLADPVFSKTDERVKAELPVRQSGGRETRSGEAVRGQNTSESELLRAVRDFSEADGIEIERLPSTRKEAEAILGLVPKADQFEALDFQANRSAATSSGLSQYRIVHFATHGLLNPTHPGLSGLILSLVDRQGNDQNGFLATHEIFDLNLPADLVVLSGCRTGLGKEIKGEGMLGLTRGFMYAGAARVAVSLWDVNDRSTAELMGKFYGAMLGKKKLSPAAAMRNAQIAMWKSRGFNAPYYWAAFVLQGEYR